jgi:hypothetical protein
MSEPDINFKGGRLSVWDNLGGKASDHSMDFESPYPNLIDTPVNFDHIYQGPAYNPIYININRATFQSTNKNDYLPRKGKSKE